MKHTILSLILSAGAVFTAPADDLVILSTNDTHSAIDTDANGVGGILPRKAIIDSVRNAEKNVILVDAGDMVQGSLYFKNFKGDVEYPLFNMMDYDIRILGNHEFDNGLEQLAGHWKNVKGARLSANYDFKGTPAEGVFQPYVIKRIGGKKIGFFGINVDPESLIIKDNYKGMKYSDAITKANETASFLRNRKKCDLVVAVTHIGYAMTPGKSSDVELARNSHDIDIIIGGHSHTFVNPETPESTPYRIKNADGVPVLVTQTGKYGRNLGYIKINLEKLKDHDYEYKWIPVTDRFPRDAYDKNIINFLAPYKHVVDSINNNVLGWSIDGMQNSVHTGAYPNWAADFILAKGKEIADSLRAEGMKIPEVDLGIMNIGGIRQPMPKGAVTEGNILSTFPFKNALTLISIKGKDIMDALRIATVKGGEGISANVKVLTDGKGNMRSVVINGKEMDPEKEYIVSTIDYIAQGNDDYVTMAHNREIWHDSDDICNHIIRYIKRFTASGIPLSSDPNPRFVKDARLEINGN